MIAPSLVLWLALLAQPATATPTPPPSAAASEPVPAASKAAPLCRNPDASGIYRIGCGFTSPVPIRQPEPKYPRGLSAGKLILGVAFSLTVNVYGDPVNVHIIHSHIDNVAKENRSDQQEFEDDMVDSIRQYKFKPAMFQGKPVPVELNIEINMDPF